MPKVGSHELRSDPAIFVVLYESVCSVTKRIGEFGVSPLKRLEARGWGSRTIASQLRNPLTRFNFRFNPAWETINLGREVAPPNRKAATPTAIRGLGERLSSPSGSGRSPAAKVFWCILS
jgi:hypothetical protein